MTWWIVGTGLLAAWLWLLATALASADERPAPAPTSARVPPVSLPAKVTLADAIRIFRAAGLDLFLADAAVESARGQLQAASALINPAVSGGRGSSATYDPSQCGTPGCSNAQYSGSVSDQGAVLEVLSGKRRLRVQAARAALRAGELSRRDAERTLGFAVKQQYVAAALAKAALGLTEESRAANEQTFRLVQARYDAGAVSEADLARAEAAALEAQQARDLAAQSLRQAKVTLAFLLGVRAAVPDYDVGDEPMIPREGGPLAASTPESLISLALTQRADLAAAEAQRARAVAGLRLAERERVPDVSLGAQYTREGTGQSAIQPPTTAFSLAFTVPIFYRRQGEIAIARADMHTQELQQARVTAQVVADVEGSLAAARGARLRIDRMDSRLMDRTRRARDLVQVQYEMGAASLLELLDAQRTLIAAGVERVQILSDYWTAVFQLEEAVGMELHE